MQQAQKREKNTMENLKNRHLLIQTIYQAIHNMPLANKLETIYFINVEHKPNRFITIKATNAKLLNIGLDDRYLETEFTIIMTDEKITQANQNDYDLFVDKKLDFDCGQHFFKTKAEKLFKIDDHAAERIAAQLADTLIEKILSNYL